MKKLALLVAFFAAITTHAQDYQTSFPATTSILSENGNWRDGGPAPGTGLVWGNVQTTPAFAFGTTSTGTCGGGSPTNCNDSTAVLTGTWASNQAACIVVDLSKLTNRDTAGAREVEVRIRTTIAANNITGYEFNYGLGATLGPGFLYAGVVRWNGPKDNFTGLTNTVISGSLTALQTGDQYCASAIGSTLTGWVVRSSAVVFAFTATDATYTGGSPGIGFFNSVSLADNANYGISNFHADNYGALSCNQTDVNKVINGPTHTAVNGDNILIPAGSCTWTSVISVPGSIGVSIIGNGVPNTTPATTTAGTLNTSITHGGFAINPIFGNATSRISTINLLPSAGAGAPITVNGTCTVSGCPNLRLDNLFFPTSWSNLGLSDGSVAIVTNMFGVADHNTVGDVPPIINYVNFLNLGHGEWQGIGQFGDNSFATPLTFGTAQAFYLENNFFASSLPTDSDIPDPSPLGGGARVACRFNTANPMNTIGFCSGHGTETTGRPRGLAQFEGYFNQGNCTDTHIGCGSAWPGRSGTGMSFGNKFTTSGGGFFGGLNNIDPQRRWRPQSNLIFGGCNTLLNPSYDTNDGGATPTIYATGTVTAPSTIPTSQNYTITTSGSWGGVNLTPVVAGNPYTFVDVTGNFGFEIQSFTTNTLTVYVGCQTTSCTGSGPPSGLPANGDVYQIRRSSVCIDQSNRSQGVLLSGHNNPTPAGPVNQILTPSYEANDSLPASASHTYSSNTFSEEQGRDYFAEGPNQSQQTSPTVPFSGIVATPQAITGWSCNNPTNSCTYNIASTTGFTVSTPPSFATIVAVPIGLLHSYNPTGTFPIKSIVANTSITLTIVQPNTDNAGAGGFASTIGAGHGTLANRPTSCSIGAGYWATDQGNWNQSGNGLGQGQLFTCTAPNTWSLTYTPFCYPHPLTTGGVSLCGAGTPGISFSPASVAFGNVLVGSTSPSTLVTLTNTGSAILNISNVAIAGTNPADFAQTNNCGTSVLVGGSCTITTTCTPLSAASFSATVSVTDNAAGSPQTVPLTCTGTNASPAIQFSPTSIAFAARTVGTSSSPTSITVTNTGGATLTITNVSILGGNSTSFTQTNNCGSVAPLGTCTINVTFSPQSAGALASNVSVVDNAAGSPQTVPISGTGTGVAAIGLNPTNLAFGNQAVTVTSTAISVSVSNPGTASLTLSSITLTGTNAADFAISANTCGGSLAINATCSVSVTFTPPVTGARTANLTFTDNAPASPQNVALTGTGTQAATSFSPTNLAFGNQTLSTTSPPLTTTLTNVGSATLNISSIAITGTNASDFLISSKTCGTTLTATSSCTVSVTFTPSATTTRSANLSFTDNAPGNPQTVPLSGTGLGVSGISFVPSSLSFPATVVGQSSAVQQIKVQNTGSINLTISSIAIAGSDFTQTNNCIGGAMIPSQFCFVNVTFSPAAAGARSSNVAFTDTAPGSPQSVAISGTGTQAGAQVVPTSIAFGSQNVGTTSAAQNVTLTNNGTATLNISSITLGGTNPSYFSISSNTCGSTLAPTLSCIVGLTFTPQTAIAATASLSIADDGPGNPQSVALSGTGTFLALSFNPASLSFGSVNVGTTSAPLTITMTNTGNGTTTISGIALTGTNPGDYSQTNNCPPSLAGGGSCTITVKFLPTASGARSANVQVTDNAPGSPQTVPLSGTGVTPTAGISLSPTSLTFASQGVGTSSAPQSITVSNPGSANLVISGISISGDYSQTNNCTTVAPAGNCTVNVTFSPTTTGTRTGTLTINDNAGGSPHTAPLSGTGAAAAVSFVPASLTFPSTPVGSASAALTTTLMNTGGASLTSVVISIVGTNASNFSQTNNCGSTVLAGGSCTINVTFTPSANGVRTASVQVVDNIGTQTVSLQGTGFTPAPLVSLSVTSINFGNQTTGTASNQRVVILTNTGTASLTISSTSITGTNAGDFGVTTTCGGSLAVNVSCAYQFTFMPSAAGARSATFNLNTNAASSPDHVSLSGTGVTSPGGSPAPQVFGDD